MKNKMFCLVVLAGLAGVATNAPASVDSSRNRGSSPIIPPKIEQIAIDGRGIPILLDNGGHVWAFSRKPLENSNVIYPLIIFPKLSGIKQIAPYIALDNSGNVFTWSHASNTAAFPFSRPMQYMGIRNVTSIFPESSAYEIVQGGIEDQPVHSRYIVVVNNQDIYQLVIDENGVELAPKKLFSSNEIKSVAVSGYHKKGFVQNVIVLMKDGDLLNISIPSQVRVYPKKRARRFGSAPPPVVAESVIKEIQISKLGNFPTATAVSANSAHVVLLDESGGLLYLGECDAIQKSSDGKWIPIEGSKQMESLINNVAQLELHSRKNDDVFSNALIKKDGSIWLDSPPSPSGFWGNRSCEEIQQSDYAKNPEQLFIGAFLPKQIYFGDDRYYVLDANHDLWMLYAYNRMYYKKLPKNQLTKIELNFSNKIKGSGAKEVKAIETAVQLYNENSSLKINIGEVKGNFAWAVTIPDDSGRMDAATVYLKKEEGNWFVTDFGTGAMPPEDYPHADVPTKK